MHKIIASLRYRIHRFFAQLSKPTMVYGYKKPGGKLLKNTRISTSTVIVSPQTLQIEDNVFIGHFNFIEASNGISIGEGVQITNFVSITSHSSHHAIRLYGEKYRSVKNKIGYIKGEIAIGAYTFVGPHSLILPNTHIGKGCIISAYSKVSGDFPDYAIISGNPAKVVGTTQPIDQRYINNHPELKESYYNSDFI